MSVEQLLLRQNVKSFIKSFSLLLSENMLYESQHPKVFLQARNTFESFNEIFTLTDSVYIDIIENQFVFEGTPLYDLKYIAKKTLQLLESKSIECLCFKKGVTQNDILFFSGLLVDKKRPLGIDGIRLELKISEMNTIVIEKRRLKKGGNENIVLQPEKVYGASIEANKMVYNAVFEGKDLPLDIIDKVAKDITRMVSKDNNSGLSLTTLRDYDDYTFTHSSNVAILAVILASNITNDPELLSRISRAALLHDIGKVKIPTSLLNKTEKLTPDEWEVIRQHPLNGARLLEHEKYNDALVTTIAAQHHMKFDKSGYPNLEDDQEIHPLSLLTGICDVYDAITTRRAYKNKMPYDKAIAFMIQLIGRDFDPYFLKIFTQMVGIYPSGVFVQLNTGEIAIVQNVQPQALLLPQIKIIINKNETLLEEPIFLDLSDMDSNTSGRSIKSIIDTKEHGIDALSFLTQNEQDSKTS